MPSLKQSTRHATLYSPLGEDVISLRSLHATEQLGRMFTLEIEIDSERDDIKADDLIGQSICIEAELPTGGERYFHGFVNHFSHAPRAGRRYLRYSLTAVPWMWMLTRQTDCRIFQNKSVPDILRDVFGRRGFSQFKVNLHGTYEPWEYCVQYRETDFNFVSRLMEQEGIYYYFEHTKEEHTLILVDSPDAHLPFPKYEKVLLKARAGSHGTDDELLREWQREHRHHSGAYAQTDYDFMRPRVDLATHNQQPGEFALPEYEVYDYPGEYIQYKGGEDWAKVRMEEIRAERVVYHTSGNVVGVAVGHKFALSGPPGFKDDGDYLVVGSSIHLKSGVYETGGSGGEEEGETFTVAATLVPAAEPFRATRLTPKPVIQGVQTAIVTGPAGEEIHTDKYGRIKVQFHWDRVGQLDENTTCFIRVGQVWAGKRWGATFIPRIGQEVIVAFLEGDPDQPIVVGSVYNGEQMPPYLGEGPDPKHKHDPKVSGIKSLSTKGGAGFNELRFDDNKGKEEIFLHAEKDLDVRVKNDERVTIGGNVDLTVGTDQGGGIVEVKTADKVGVHIKKNFAMQADLSYYLTVSDSGKFIETIEKDGTHANYAAKEFTYKAGKIVLEAESTGEICLKVGSNFIQIKPDGIYIKGTMVYINSGGSPTPAPTPPESHPKDPALADDSKPGFLSALGAVPTPPPPTPEPRDRAAGKGPFATQDAAAKAALHAANPNSKRDNLEYAGQVYKGKDGKYYYTGPVKGTDQGANPSAAPAPAGTTVVGDYHTHGDYSTVDPATGKAVRTHNPALDQFNSDNFSTTDKTGIASDATGKPGYKGYLGTPSGNFRSYDPATGTDTTF